jgi:hypothetical protein
VSFLCILAYFEGWENHIRRMHRLRCLYVAEARATSRNSKSALESPLDTPSETWKMMDAADNGWEVRTLEKGARSQDRQVSSHLLSGALFKGFCISGGRLDGDKCRSLLRHVGRSGAGTRHLKGSEACLLSLSDSNRAGRSCGAGKDARYRNTELPSMSCSQR